MKLGDSILHGALEKGVQDPGWNSTSAGTITEDELEIIIWGKAESGGNINVETLFATITENWNLSTIEDQGTTDPNSIHIGDRDYVKKKSAELSRELHKEPDFAGYENLPGTSQHLENGPTTVDNHIPDDVKLHRKIRRTILPSDEEKYENSDEETMKIVRQIHDYMERHDARYGYLASDEGLIFLERRETGWGHLDISQAVRHDIDGRARHAGISTASYDLQAIPSPGMKQFQSCPIQTSRRDRAKKRSNMRLSRPKMRYSLRNQNIARTQLDLKVKTHLPGLHCRLEFLTISSTLGFG